MHLEIVQHHELGTSRAKAKLQGMANGSLPHGLKLIKAVWEEGLNRLTLDLQFQGGGTAYRLPIQAVVNIAPTSIEIHTNDLPWYTAPFLPFIKAELQASLQKALV